MPGVLPKLIVVKGCGPSQTRIAQACDRCRSKKIRCDGHRPTCSQCSAVGFECRTSDKLSRRAFPRGYTESLEERVRALEREVRELKDLIDIKDDQLEVLSRLHSFNSPYSPPTSAISSTTSFHKPQSPPAASSSSHSASSPAASSDSSSVSPMMQHHSLHQHPEQNHLSDIAEQLPQTSLQPTPSPVEHTLPPSFKPEDHQANDYGHPSMPTLTRTRSVQHPHPSQNLHKAAVHMRAQSVSFEHHPAMQQQQWRAEAVAAAAARRNANAEASAGANGTSDEWERMLAIIDASHAAHIYGDAGGTVMTPAIRLFDKNSDYPAEYDQSMPPPSGPTPSQIQRQHHHHEQQQHMPRNSYNGPMDVDMISPMAQSSGGHALSWPM